MTREEIIRMAREADREGETTIVSHQWLERFAALVAAAEREPLTEEEISEIFISHGRDKETFARAIERAHGIGGEE